MCTKFKFYKTGFFVTFFLFFLCAQPLSAKNVLGRPRRMYLIKTEHFDIIYSNKSEETALLLVENADRLYQKAVDTINALDPDKALAAKINLHMPVIISPDSDLLSIEYTPIPYNRIILFDSPADYQTAGFEDSLLSLFYRELVQAVAQSIRSPFNQFIATWMTGDIYQPVAIYNLPYSFIEGLAYLAEADEDGDGFSEGLEGRLNDGYFLQILSQAKLEGKFPKWIQITNVRDTYPGEELALAAGAGFSAFLMNAYGVEKYAKLWEESGKINPLLTQGVFKNTYGKKLNELWAEFEASVPLPDGLMEAESFEREGEILFPNDKEANYEHILITEYGTVWYDRLRHEVDIFDDNNTNKMRQLLFLADNVERMALSPDGRYMAVSYTQARYMEDLSTSLVWIYDLRERRFLEAKYNLRDAAIVKRTGGEYALAGVNVQESRAKLQVYTLPCGEDDGDDPELIFSQIFERNEIPFSPVYGGDGFISYIRSQGKENFLCRLCFDQAAEQGVGLKNKWLIKTDSADQSSAEGLKPGRLSYNPPRAASLPQYTFVFTLPHEHTYTRAGFIYLNENFEPQSVQLAAADLSGGINFPVLGPSEKLFYSAKKYAENQLRSVELSSLPLAAGELVEAAGEDGKAGELDNAVATQAAGELGEAGATLPLSPHDALQTYNVRWYNPIKYMLDFSFTPFFPIKTLDLNEKNLYWPGLGLTIESQTDPCMNTKALLSAGWTYLPLDFSWTNNMPSSYLAKFRTESLNLSKDKSAAFYIENTSTPVELKAGVIFNCNRNGEYTFKVIGGGQWKIPIGLAIRHFVINLQGSYSASTDYYDQSKSELHPSLSNWPSFKQAYELYEISARIEYTNIHQYGFSTFEQRGILLGMKAYAMWDMVELRQLEDPKISDVTQLNFSFYGKAAIPGLLPFTGKNHWVLSMPALLNVEFVNKPGTAFESSFQVLLIGREIHNTAIPYFMYARRAGLWFGYNMALVYDTTEVSLPDIRRDNYLAELFKDIRYTHALYMVLNFDFNLALGQLSTVPINTTLTGTWFPESNGYQITLDMRFKL